MAATPAKGMKWSKLDEVRLASAVKKIAEDRDLRFLFRTLLSDFGVTSPVGGVDLRSITRSAALQEAGFNIIGLFDEFDTMLYPALLVEYHQEAAIRSGKDEPEADTDENE